MLLLLRINEVTLREHLSSMISESFVEELEGSFRGNYKIGSKLKTTPKYLKELEDLANLYLVEGYKEKQKVTINKIYSNPHTQKEKFVKAESRLLFLSSVYLSINFLLKEETNTIFRKKILEATEIFNQEFEQIRNITAHDSASTGIAKLAQEDYIKNISSLDYWSGIGIYLFRNILGMNRIYFSNKLNKGSATGIYKIEKDPKYFGQSKTMTKSFWFDCFDVLLKRANDLNKLDDFVFIVSNLDIGQNIIENSFDWFKSDEFKKEFKEKHLKALECINKIRESNYKTNYLDLVSTYSIRAVQFYWLQNIYGNKPDKLENFDGRVYIDSDSFSFTAGQELSQITRPLDSKAWLLKKALMADSIDYDPSEYIHIPDEEDLLISSFIFKDLKARKDIDLDSLAYHKVEDASMETDFSNGDIVIVEKDQEYDGVSKYYLLIYNNQFLIRKLIPSIENKNVYLIKASNEDFPNMELKNYDFDIYGKVISSIKSSL